MSSKRKRRAPALSTPEEELTPWLDKARKELEMLRRQHAADSAENRLLGIVEDILTTAEDAISCIRSNSWPRLFVFLERIEEKAHEGLDQLGTSLDVQPP